MREQNKLYTRYFSYNSKEKYAVDYTQQQKTRLDEEKNDESFNIAKSNYKDSQELYGVVKADSSLLTKLINDPGFKYYNDKTKIAILEYKLHTLKPLMVNANSASRASELNKYIKEKKRFEKMLNELKRSKLETHLIKNKVVNDNAKKVKSYLEKISDFLRDLFLLGPASFVAWIGELNIYRLSYTFSRISWKNLWTYLKSINILDSSSKLKGVFVNIAMMDYPAQTFNALSVLIFATKISVNLTIPIKHMLDPTSRVETAFGWFTRFKMELYRVWDVYFNDIFWMIFNGITNFPMRVGLAIPVANWILTGALLFDVALLSFLWGKEEINLGDEIAWLKKQDYAALQKRDDTSMVMYGGMIVQAEISLSGIRAKFIACIIATALFITSLALVLSLATPLMAPISFFVCVLAVSIILSRNEIANYAEAKSSQEKHKNTNEPQDIKTERAKISKQQGWQLAKTLAENIIVPMVIVGVFTVSWPAAIALTAIYILFKASRMEVPAFEKDENDDEENDVDVAKEETPLLLPS